MILPAPRRLPPPTNGPLLPYAAAEHYAPIYRGLRGASWRMIWPRPLGFRRLQHVPRGPAFTARTGEESVNALVASTLATYVPAAAKGVRSDMDFVLIEESSNTAVGNAANHVFHCPLKRLMVRT